MTIRELIRDTKRQLADAGVGNPAFEAACIFEKHTGIKRHEIPAVGGKPSDRVPPAFFEDLKRRLDGEPLQYVLGEWEFMGLDFRIGPGVLIPRADTEILAGAALEFLRRLERPEVLELCFGSGCVGISLAALHKGCRVEGVELSPRAIWCAEENIRRHGLGDRVSVRKGDMLKGICEGLENRRYDLLVCNPPYIPSGEIGRLDVSVRDYEPHLALDGGKDGLDFYRAAEKWFPLVKRGGMGAFETGAGQAEQAAEILRGGGLGGIVIIKDYAGIERVVSGTLSSCPGNSGIG